MTNPKKKPTEADFLAAIKAAPEDDAPRAAYADLMIAADHPRGWWMRSQIYAADETKPLDERRRAQDRDASFFRQIVDMTDQRARGDLANEREVTLGFDTPPARLGEWTMTLRGASPTPDDDVFYELVYVRGMLAGIDVRVGRARDLERVASVLGRAAVRLFGASLPLLHAYLQAGALVDIAQLRVHGPVSAGDLEPLLALPLLRELDLSDATFADRAAIEATVARRAGIRIDWPSPPTRRCRVSLEYRLVREGVPTAETQQKTWFFEVPRAWATGEGFRELLNRIFFDANEAMRAREPGDRSHLALDSFTVSPVNLAETLSWDGTATMEAAAKHLPWIIAHRRLVWEPAACLVVDDAGRYDGMEGNDFSELVVYRALEEGVIGEAEALAFVQKLFPGGGPSNGQRIFDDRAARMANLVMVRPQPGRRTPNQRPCVARLPHLDVHHNRAIVHGLGGSYRFRTTFGPGEIGADPYGGPGGRVWSTLSLYVRGAGEVVFVDTITEDIYGPVSKHEVYVAVDRCRDFRLDPNATQPPSGPDVERLANVSLETLPPIR